MLREGAEFALALYPPEGCFLLDLDELSAPGVSVFVARDDAGVALGMAALVDNTDSTGELKRMFVRDAARGHGVATLLLEALEAAARESSIHTLRLETGTLHVAAQALYAKHGFDGIAPFGPYVGSEYSVCMQKSLG
ncbi:MAG: GNAT family N-acetyltransferase [Microcella sp.]|nr:MAG: GNAT family N-acetyltransferase [Microcella sp.]